MSQAKERGAAGGEPGGVFRGAAGAAGADHNDEHGGRVRARAAAARRPPSRDGRRRAGHVHRPHQNAAPLSAPEAPASAQRQRDRRPHLHHHRRPRGRPQAGAAAARPPAHREGRPPGQQSAPASSARQSCACTAPRRWRAPLRANTNADREHPQVSGQSHSHY